MSSQDIYYQKKLREGQNWQDFAWENLMWSTSRWNVLNFSLQIWHSSWWFGALALKERIVSWKSVTIEYVFPNQTRNLHMALQMRTSFVAFDTKWTFMRTIVWMWRHMHFEIIFLTKKLAAKFTHVFIFWFLNRFCKIMKIKFWHFQK